MQPYAGDLSPKEAWKFLKEVPSAIMVDVRSAAEWQFVGVCDLSSLDKDVNLIEWASFPGMAANEKFVEQLKDAVTDLNQEIIFICRTGGRSKSAAILAASNGYINSYNVSYGFEGDMDNKSHRATVNGWKFDELPWRQF